MHLWWSLCTLYLHACQVTVTIGSRLRSLLLYLCYVFQALINYLVCRFCMSTLGLLLFQIYFLPAANNATSVSNQKLDFDFLSPAKGGESQSQKTRTKTQQNSTNSSCCDSDNITVPWAWLVYIYIHGYWALYRSELAQELCESRGGHPGLPSLISLRFLWT